MITLEHGRNILKTAKVKLGIKIIYYIIIAGAFFSIGNASVTEYGLSPFALPLLFALLWCGAQPFVLAFIYLGSALALDFSQTNITIAVIGFLIVVIAGLIHKRIKKAPNLVECNCLLLVSYLPFVLLNASHVKSGLAVMVAVLLGCAFMFACVSFFAATIRRSFNIKLNLDEQLCGGIILVVASMGLSKLNFYGLEAIKVIAPIIILASTYIFSGGTTIMLGAIMGLGFAITAGNPVFIAAFVCYAVASLAFKTNYRVLSCVGIVIAELMFGLYFKGYVVFGWQSVVSVGLGGLLFLITPKKVLAYITDMLGGQQTQVAVRNIVNRSKQNVCKRILEIGNVFKEMDSVFRGMVKGSLAPIDAKEVLTNELVQKVCVNCSEYNKCLRVNGEYTTDVLKELVGAGYEKGRVTVIDVSQYLSSRCIKLHQLINAFNNLVDNYKKRSDIMSSLDASRILIADQLGGVNHIMKQFVSEINKNITFDLTAEKKIMEELAYKNIACMEAIVYEQDVHEKNITLLVKNYSVKEGVIEKVVSRVCKSSMQIVSVVPAEISNASVIMLKTRLNFDIVFGSATLAKNHQANGDAHSIIKLNNGKYLLAVCDGMGNGINAKRTSSLAISLIENFYKAGFENEMILSSVNKLLALSNDENFSALDLCVLDMRKNNCDFIKLGSPTSYIKHKNSTDEVEGSGLPIGIIDEMQPKSKKVFLHPFDVVVLVSDGVADAFGKTSLKTLINNITSINPQTIADEIMLAAKRSLGEGSGLNDDMTVVVARVFPTTAQ